ncbi:MAG: dihydroneopterin aldolase [Flavisolibacter sp.]
MAGKFTISLNGLRFFADHGIFTEEKKVGHEFELNISMEMNEPPGGVQHISDTINYAEVYRLVQHIFRQRKLLLETLAVEIAGTIKKQFPQAENISVTITKFSPPITNFTGSVSVNYSGQPR